MEVELHLPECSSLKEKRSVIRHLLETARRRFAVSASEVDHHDLHQRAEISLACVAGTPGGCNHILDDALALVESEPRAVVLSAEREVG